MTILGSFVLNLLVPKLLEIMDLSASYMVEEYLIKSIGDSWISEELLRYKKMLERGSSDLRVEALKQKFNEILENFYRSGSFEIYALTDVNLELSSGIMGVVGESGSGKSTLAYLILGLKPSNLRVLSGKIMFDNVDMLSDPVGARRIRATYMGYVGQGSYTYLNPMMESAYQILESAEVASRSEDEALKLFLRAIEKAELDRRIILSYPKQLSGGEVRRIAIAIAFAKKLRLLVGDEPFRNMDVYHAVILADYLKGLIEETEASAIIFSHNISLLSQIADQIAVMYNGVIVEKGPVVEIFKRPKHPYTKGLIGAIPDIRKPKKKLIFVPGEPIPRFIKPSFCPFFNRCPYATEDCLRGIPKARIVDGVEVRCNRIDEIAEATPEEFWGPYI